ncbi:MAG: DUF2235 domain-containing protein, partial [Acidobacteria bacterium]|nr:DUF2235 domain-containing protein [Acidobacteriota bacterium]
MVSGPSSSSPGPRRLVLCLDGTWNRANPLPGVYPTNALRLARAVAVRDGEGREQTVFYQEGVGTASFFDSSIRGFTGHGIVEKIREAYLHVAEHWRPEDALYLFGVSRGAFAALQLTRLLGRYGLPPKPEADAWERVWSAWLAGEDRADADWRRPPVDFLGAWDTVEALGLPVAGLRGPTTPAVGARGPLLGATVRCAYHALAFHERRIAFHPTLWQAPFPPGCVVEQRWFRGAHADVCGGFGNPALADVSLKWMIGHARQAGLVFDEALLERTLRPDPKARMSPLRTGWHRILPLERRLPRQTSPESETMDEAVLDE